MTIKKAVILGCGTLLLLAMAFLQPLRFIDALFYDLNFMVSSSPATDSVVVVAVDPKSMDPYAWPWPRARQAALFNAISQCNPAVVALDFLFVNRDDPEGNDSLRMAFSRIGNLVLPFRLNGVSSSLSSAVPPVPATVFRQRFLRLENQERLKELSLYSVTEFAGADTSFTPYARYGGFLNVSTSRSSQKLREVIHVIRAGDEYYPSFALSAVAAYRGIKPDQMVLSGAPAVDLGGLKIPLSSYAATAYINYRSSTRPIITISAADVLAGTVDPSRLRGRLVFVGITDPAAGADFFLTPVRPQFPGVEVWATAALDIIERSWVRWGGGPLEAVNWILALMLFPGLALLLPSRFRRMSTVLGLVLIGGSIGLSIFLFKTAHYFWNPANHCWAWLFSVIWLAIQKADPSLVIEIRPIELDPPAGSAGSDVIAPPKESEYIKEVPASPTSSFVLDKVAPGTIAGSAGGGSHTALGTFIEQTPDSNSTQQFNADGDAPSMVSIPEESLEKFRMLCNGLIVRLLGSGGMADVYLIWNPRLEMYRAVKVLKPGIHPTFQERFETEIRIFAKLVHPNIVQCYGVGEWHGLPCMEMEFINGTSFESILAKTGKLTAAQTVAVGILLCRALEYAHAQSMTIYGKNYSGVIHRDLKPANVMLSRDGHIKLADFGIARPTAVGLHTTDSTSIVGTLPYLAPEQLDAGDNVGPQSDVYALGATLYEMATGSRAFPQTDMTTLIKAKTMGSITPMIASDAMPASCIAVITRALETDRSKRYPSILAMKTDFEKCFRSMVKEKGYSHLQDLSRAYWG